MSNKQSIFDKLLVAVANTIVRILRNEHGFTHSEQEQIKQDIAYIRSKI